MTIDIKKAKRQFGTQKWCAGRRGIEWNMSLNDWINIWEKSGHYDNRGPRKGQYVMSRYGDQGPYESSNVYINTCEGNHSEATKGKAKTQEHKEKLRQINLGKKRSLESRLQQSQNSKGRILPKIECSYCKKHIDTANFKRWHGDQCKERTR